MTANEATANTNFRGSQDQKKNTKRVWALNATFFKMEPGRRMEEWTIRKIDRQRVTLQIYYHAFTTQSTTIIHAVKGATASAAEEW